MLPINITLHFTTITDRFSDLYTKINSTYADRKQEKLLHTKTFALERKTDKGNNDYRTHFQNLTCFE